MASRAILSSECLMRTFTRRTLPQKFKSQHSCCLMSSHTSDGDNNVVDGENGQNDEMEENKDTSRILSRSHLFVQDGTHIQELPVIVRKLQANELSFGGLLRQTYSHDMEFDSLTDQDAAFKLRLKSCNSAEQVFTLLELPCDTLSAYSASSALERLSQLSGLTAREAEEGSSHRSAITFIQRAVLRDLCDTAVSDIARASISTLETLMRCRLLSDAYPESFVKAIDDEFDSRLASGVMSVTELCWFVQNLSESIRGSSDRVNNIFVHLASRCKDIKADDIAVVWSVLRYLSPQSRFILPLLDKCFLTCCSDLHLKDIVTVCKVLPMTNHINRDMMSHIADWVFTHAEELQDDSLLTIVTAFSHYNVFNMKLINVLERYSVHASDDQLQPMLAAVAMEYCRQQRWVSSTLFDRVAIRFTAHWQSYTTTDVLMTVRPFGQLNYRPPASVGNSLYDTLDLVLRERMLDLKEPELLNILVGCAYVERYPINFTSLIFSPTFMSKLQDLPAKEQSNAILDLMELRQCLLTEQPHLDVAPLLGSKLWMHKSFDVHSTWFCTYNRHFGTDSSSSSAERKILDTWKELRAAYGAQYIKHPHLTPCGMKIQFVMNLDKNKNLLDVYTLSKETPVHTRLALIPTTQDDYLVSNKRQLVGEMAMYVRHMERLGYTPVLVQHRHVKSTGYFQRLLEPYIAPSLPR